MAPIVFCRLAVAVLCLIACPVNADERELGKEITAAWKRREASIKSLHLECAVEVTTMVTETRADDPFSRPRDKNSKWRPVTLQREIKFSMDGGKRATEMSGDHWNPQLGAPVEQRTLAAYDGKLYTSLFESGEFRSAQIAPNVSAGGMLTAFWLVPLNLSIEPSSELQRHGYEIDHPQTHFRKTRYDGKDCIEISMVQRYQGRLLPVRPGRLYVMTADYLPVEFVREVNGKPSSEYRATHAIDKQFGPVIDSWTAQRFAETGELQETYSIKVKRRILNKPLDATLLRFRIPPGTPTTEENERGERTRFIEDANGERQPMPTKPPGRQVKEAA
jgi:hypothetical protein